MLETAITMTCLFIVFAYLLTKKLGLLDPVPRDPKARVASYTSSVLSMLKSQLTNAKLQNCEPTRVAFLKGPSAGSIWASEGNVHCQFAGTESTLPLGDLGQLSFDLQGPQLSITILAAESDGEQHTAQVSLPVAR